MMSNVCLCVHVQDGSEGGAGVSVSDVHHMYSARLPSRQKVGSGSLRPFTNFGLAAVLHGAF